MKRYLIPLGLFLGLAVFLGVGLDRNPHELPSPLVGLDYKDAVGDARAWLAQHGDPYLLSAVDASGRVGIDYGVYGVPETYVIDKRGTIRFKQVGPLSAELLQARILPLIRELQQ